MIRASRGRTAAPRTRQRDESAQTRERLAVTVQIATQRRGIPHPRTLARWADAAFAAAARSPHGSSGALTIRIVGTSESRKLNRTWRGKDKPTNVLSFPAMDPTFRARTSAALAPAYSPELTANLLGDLAVCAAVVRREAHEQGKELNAHWAHMIVHGVLHLLGYDHENERDAQRMEGLEIRILARMGIDNPYLEGLAA